MDSSTSTPSVRASADVERLPPPLAGRYRLDAELGGGADARVFRAHDTTLHRDVAVKLLRARTAGPARLAEQQREAQLLARVNHRALVTL